MPYVAHLVADMNDFQQVSCSTVSGICSFQNLVEVVPRSNRRERSQQISALPILPINKPGDEPQLYGLSQFCEHLNKEFQNNPEGSVSRWRTSRSTLFRWLLLLPSGWVTPGLWKAAPSNFLLKRIPASLGRAIKRLPLQKRIRRNLTGAVTQIGFWYHRLALLKCTDHRPLGSLLFACFTCSF